MYGAILQGLGFPVTEFEENRDIIRLAQTTLISLRRTLDLPFESMVRQKQEEAASLYRSILMDLESARLLIAPLRNVREPPSDIVAPLSSLARELTRMVENPEYARLLRPLKYRRFPDAGAARPVRTPPRYQCTECTRRY